MLLRLDKILGDAGWGSRAELRDAVKVGRVDVDGVTVRDAAVKLDPLLHAITLDGGDIDYLPSYTYMLHKPPGLLTATEDAHQPTVYSLLPERLRRMGLVPVGRLDKDTTGLLLLTTDGALSHALTSPKRQVDKTYRVTVDGALTPAHAARIADGLELGDGLHCQPGRLEILSPCVGLLTIHEGKFHQVKRMMAALGCPVTALHRVSIGGLVLEEGLASGDFRRLTPDEVRLLITP